MVSSDEPGTVLKHWRPKYSFVDLNPAIQKSENVIREMVAQYDNPVLLWAGGKDSTTMVYLARLALPLEVMPPCVFIDTGYQFRETIDFIRKWAKWWKLKLIFIENREAKMEKCSPEWGHLKCCTLLKTDALARAIEENGWDAVAVGIRWDEQDIRAKEYYFSERYDPDHVRVHPMLHWRIQDIWRYIEEENIPYNPLYDRIKDGKTYKSIGCAPCTEMVDIEGAEERSGRVVDKEDEMYYYRALGYM